MSTSAERMRRMRERRRAGLLPVDGEPPLPPEERLLPAVEETLNALALEDSDQAAAALARQFARLIDRASDQRYALRWLGPELHRVLESLQATPASRPAAKPAPAGPSQLDRLRAARRPGHPL